MFRLSARASKSRIGAMMTALAGLLLAAGTTLASMAEFPELPLQRHHSPSGDWELTIDPSNRQGAGAAAYEMRKAGKLRWRATHDFSMWEVAVDDAGRVGGVAYDTGLFGGMGNAGRFIVAIFDAEGRVVAKDQHAREHSRFLHDFPHPQSTGVFIDQRTEQLVVRVGDPDINVREEHWWRYRLSDGKRIGSFTPARPEIVDARLLSVMRVQPIAGQPLVLVQWLRSESSRSADGVSALGTQVALLGEDNRILWTYALPADLAGIEGNAWRAHEATRALRSNAAGEFSVLSLARNRWLEFVAIPDPDSESGWRVETRGTTAPTIADNPRMQVDRLAAAPVRDLQALGVIDLLAQEDAEATQWILDFDLDVDGAIGRVERSGCDCETSFLRWVLHDPDGKPLASLRLDALGAHKGGNLELAALRKGQWLVVASSAAGKTAARAAMIDPATGSITLLPSIGLTDVQSIVGTADGGFVALSSKHETYSTTDQLSRHDATGKLLWRIEEDYAVENALFSPEDVTVLANGEIAVLENIRNQVKLFDDHGHHRETLSLEALWGREPNYPGDISADHDGGFLIQDMNGKPSVVHMRRSGETIASFERTRFGDGAPFQPLGFRTTSWGGLWTSDGKTLLRLDAQGRVEAAIGALPDPSRLTEIAGIGISVDGQILAMDGRTHAVHRFDAQGQALQVLNPTQGDYDASYLSPWLLVTPDGGVLAERSPSGFVRYDAKGLRVEAGHFTQNRDASHALAIPGRERLWLLEFDAIVLADASGKTLKRFERDANGRWLNKLWTAGVAPDGTLAVQSGEGADKFITLISADGRLLATWPAPDDAMSHASSLAFDGRHVLLLIEQHSGGERRTSVAAFDRQGKAWFQSQPTSAPWWGAFNIRQQDRNELWLAGSAGKLHRFAWPESTASKH